ncbi:hypothetical protein [Niallia oryzisoli]|uniref:hypothetical protein n=1 Tax=Niallia oryzisoli TaxID=1737571 RepID=UPI003736637C
MNMMDKLLYNWHLMKSRHYQALVNDCVSTSLRNRLLIKASYHRELAQQYIDTIYPI